MLVGLKGDPVAGVTAVMRADLTVCATVARMAVIRNIHNKQNGEIHVRFQRLQTHTKGVHGLAEVRVDGS